MDDLCEPIVDEISKELAFRLIDLRSFPVHGAMSILLKDKTTGKNIIWATDAYSSHGENCSDTSQITMEAFTKSDPVILMPRIEKALEQQQERTRKKAEVFTPVWLCNRMNNYCDEEWFGRKDVFNHENEDHAWTVTEDKIQFPEGKTWQEYVDSRRMEITCGEAPYLVSRYDMATGKLIIPTTRRIGILDRKLRIVNENTETKEEWMMWAERAYQSCYGYEYQGDSLLIARINLLTSYCDYYKERWACDPTLDDVKHIANLIAWNIWQMDGLKDMVPFGKPNKNQTNLMSFFGLEPAPQKEAPVNCKIQNWRSNESLQYKICKSRGKMSKKLFDFVIGNPPYQETTDSDSTRMPPIYHIFMDAAYAVCGKVLLVTPARFLFDAGYTPSDWNQKMLNDDHFKVVFYEPVSSKIFPNTDIKGGIAVHYRDESRSFGAIGTFTTFPELNSILTKVKQVGLSPLSDIVSPALSYKLSPLMLKENPNSLDRLRTSCFTTLAEIFFEDKPVDGREYIQMIGILHNKRTYRYVRRDYIIDASNKLDKYKVILPASNGSGAIGEVLSTPLIGQPLIGQPLIGHTQSFISIGTFNNEIEAKACYKYICSKFCRVLLGILKATQHNPPEKWKYVPLQDFTDTSDIDWSTSIQDIDRQLYRKYNLSSEEIQFIESHVQEMK